jgi:acetyl-CoA acetyltransferase
MSKRYKISREAQDEYSFKSQQRTFAAQEAGPLQRRNHRDHGDQTLR